MPIEAIAKDIVVDSDPETVRRRIAAWALPPTPHQRTMVTTDYRQAAFEAISAAAAVRGIVPSTLLRKLGDAYGEHPTLIDNTLEDT